MVAVVPPITDSDFPPAKDKAVQCNDLAYVICQLFLNKAGKGKKKVEGAKRSLES